MENFHFTGICGTPTIESKNEPALWKNFKMENLHFICICGTPTIEIESKAGLKSTNYEIDRLVEIQIVLWDSKLTVPCSGFGE